METSLVWPTAHIDDAIIDRLKGLVISDNNYSARCADDLSPAYREVGLPDNVLWSIRNTLIKQKIVVRHTTILKNRDAILAEYERGADICALSVKWGYPPLYLLRAVLNWKGDFTSGQITALFGPSPPVDILGERDGAAMTRARMCDSEPLQADVARAAQIAEDKFVRRFLHIPHRTQLQLVLEQTAQHGKPVTTPDILFNEPILINGKQVNWIDYKAYVGVHGTFIMDKIAKQSKRYRQAYGPGAIVFGGGFSKSTRRQAGGAMCLDEAGCPLPVVDDEC